MLYSLLRPLLFKLPAETAHHLSLQSLKGLHHLGLIRPSPISAPTSCLGLHFPNPVGLAAGLDKNGDYIDALAALGFGFLEVGTVTPKPQDGNPTPRLFRLPQAQAIINRMGFNNKGIDYLIENVKRAQYRGIIGINIGKNASTPIELAHEDYLIGLKKAYPYASYITINISSPNTVGLRSLQQKDQLEQLLKVLKAQQQQLHSQHHKHVPLLIKLAPDLTEAEIVQLADSFKRHHIEGLIISNTTLDKTQVSHLAYGSEAGGLSGAPLSQKSTEVLALFKRELKNQVVLIGSGGVVSAPTAQAKMAAGADLVQVYSGLIYQGPKLIKQCVKALS